MEPVSQENTKHSTIEKELDETTVRILILMDQYIKCQKNIENHVRSGCLNLAKARYIVGNRNISSLQLPSEDAIGVTASFKVLKSEIDNVIQLKSIITKESLEEISSQMENVTINGEDGDKRKNIQFSNDPLKWFGFLVPQNLKQSKATFEKCLEIIVECVNVQLELQHNLDKLTNLKKSLKSLS